MTPLAIAGTVLDHVAHAVPTWEDAWPRYATELGAAWNSGGMSTGFSPGQLRFANRARLEVLTPNDSGNNDFLVRFLDRHGPGPHHLTFKVPNLSLALDAVRDAGFDPLGVSLSDPGWKEAFIHPKQATGIVVQLAQSLGEWTTPPPESYPTERRMRKNGDGPVPAASLQRVTHAVADLTTAIELFGGLLGGHIEDRGTRPGEEWIDLRWDGPLAVRLISPTDGPEATGLSEWLDGRTGRLHHVLLSCEEPDTLTGADPATPDLPGLGGSTVDGHWVVEPEDNLGLRLVAAPL